MSKSIYDLLNDVKTDVSQYENKGISPLEVQNMKNQMKSRMFEMNRVTKKKSRKKKIAAACALAAVLGLASIPFSQTAYAKGLYYDIAHFLGIEKNLQPYLTVVGETKTDNGVSVTLKEAVLDDDTMTIAAVFQFEEGFLIDNPDYSPMELVTIYINGKKSQLGAAGSSRKIGDHTYESVLSYGVGELGTGKIDVEIGYQGFLIGEKKISGNWKFTFSASQEELALSTVRIPLDYCFTLGNGCVIQIEEFVNNAMGPKLDFTFSGTGQAADYDMTLEGVDDLGNAVTFYCSSIHDGEGRFLLENMDNGNISESAKSLTLTPYVKKMPREDGRITGEPEAVGDPFTIHIN